MPQYIVEANLSAAWTSASGTEGLLKPARACTRKLARVSSSFCERIASSAAVSSALGLGIARSVIGG